MILLVFIIISCKNNLSIKINSELDSYIKDNPPKIIYQINQDLSRTRINCVHPIYEVILMSLTNDSLKISIDQKPFYFDKLAPKYPLIGSLLYKDFPFVLYGDIKIAEKVFQEKISHKVHDSLNSLKVDCDSDEGFMVNKKPYSKLKVFYLYYPFDKNL